MIASGNDRRDERGAIMVFVALFAPVLVVLLIFTIDVSNWYEHQRHLQTQADAGALAAASVYFTCNNTTIYSTAGQYAGVSTVTAAPNGATPGAFIDSATPISNRQIGGAVQGTLHALVNSTTFYGQTSTNTPQQTPDDTSTYDPCAPSGGQGASMIDVKLTETNLPWYFRLLHSVPFIDAEARVSIEQQQTATGSIPVAVNNFDPKAAEAYFVDESTGSQLGSGLALTRMGTSASGNAIWSNSSLPYALSVSKPGIGVRVGVAGKSVLTGSMTTDCAKSLVLCYDASSSSTGVLHIQGYSSGGTGSPSAPIARAVTLSTPAGSSCSDGYFTNSAANCTAILTANLDVGTNTSGFTITPVVAGKSGSALTQSGTSSTWSGSVTIPVTAPGGASSIDLTVACKANATNSACASKNTSATLTAVERAYAAGTNSGPIQAASLAEVGGAGADADSFVVGTSHNMVLTLALSGTLQDAQSTADPLYTMRFDGTGSQNQSVTCNATNGGSTYADDLSSGCAGTWSINPTLTCPDTASDCVPPATGNKQNQVAKGLNTRILGSATATVCTSPNHWGSFTFTNGVPNIPPNDPRLVSVFVTPYGSFSSSGSSTSYPIAGFAHFYVTGWQDNGNGFNNPCENPGQGDDPAAGGTIVGHFVQYIDALGQETGSGTCTPSSIDGCVAILTK